MRPQVGDAVAAEKGSREHGLRSRLAQNVGDLARLETRVERDDDTARALNAECREDPFRGIGRAQPSPVTLLDTQRDSGPYRMEHLLFQLAETPSTVPVDQRDVVAEALGGHCDDMGNGQEFFVVSHREGSRGSRAHGRPDEGRCRTRFAMMFRWIWEVPPYTDAARE